MPSPTTEERIESSRTMEPAWRFWTRELLLFGVGVATGWRYPRRRRHRIGPDALVTLTPEERALLNSWEAVRGWDRKTPKGSAPPAGGD